ncbi:MAG: RHS repeat-associated core domain-containing protein, partial [Thiotrichaceae bacterium]
MNETGITENSYRFAGEQLDSGLDQYYLRARYYNQYAGRFTQMDTWMGNNSDPVTLHKYLYGNVDPVMFTDPSGNISLASTGVALNGLGIVVNVATYAVNIATGNVAGLATQVA